MEIDNEGFKEWPEFEEWVMTWFSPLFVVTVVVEVEKAEYEGEPVSLQDLSTIERQVDYCMHFFVVFILTLEQ